MDPPVGSETGKPTNLILSNFSGHTAKTAALRLSCSLTEEPHATTGFQCCKATELEVHLLIYAFHLQLYQLTTWLRVQ